MPKRSRTAKPIKPVKTRPVRLVSKAHRQERDDNQAAFDILQQLIKRGEAEGKNPMAVALGRLGGLKGGKARAEKLTSDERRSSAHKAAVARWGKRAK
jgi:hypothetical protein